MPAVQAGLRGSSSSDSDVAPLAVPALVLGSVMLILVIACAGRIAGWASDYGRDLVVPALLIHLGLSVALLRWGAAVRRAR